MTGIENVNILRAIVHRVGNPTRGEELKISISTLTLNDEIVNKLLLKYFLGAINENELNCFVHPDDVKMNEVYSYASAMFNEKEDFILISKKLAQFLYSKSTHVKVKEGELYIVHFDNIPFGNDFVQGIGIFKSESKETFIKVFEHGLSLEVIQEDGISIHKPDKGCVIFKTNVADGYRVCVIDNTNKQQEAQYWVNDFLQVQPISNDYHHTDKYLALCKQFATQEFPEKFETNRSDQLEMMNRSMDYFKTHDHFNMDEFTTEVIGNELIADSFKEYKKNFEVARNYEIMDEFDINLSAVKKQQKLFKSVLKLDKNFHIYIHGRRDLIERGVDEAGKKFYKIYFDEEA